MARFYEMTVTVAEFDEKKTKKIQEVAENEWDFEDTWREEDNEGTGETPIMWNFGRSNLCGGEGEEEFTDRIAEAIWKANGGFCKVRVRATYLEELPYEDYEADEEDYQRLMGKKA